MAEQLEQFVGINFVGVCTHLNFTQNAGATPSLMYGRRVVLVNASPGTIQQHPELVSAGVLPHFGRLVIPASNVVAIQGPAPFTPLTEQFLMLELQGVQLTIPNALPQPQLVGDGQFITSIFNTMTCMPQLSTWIPDIVPGSASLGSNPSTAWAYFDFPAGTLQGFTMGDGAAFTDYTVRTFGDPMLLIRPFDNSTPTVVVLNNAVAGQGGVVQMVISNTPNLPPAPNENDHDNDFLLHFLAGANGFPPFPLDPPVATSCPAGQVFNIPEPWYDLNVACSNSGLP
ncbi:MAG TPA: hypothetical protein VEU30_10175 [Thermoanaerobaculia bacterium]|nr:hypothetical protein [Thermoanaerobaculia bacterium]